MNVILFLMLSVMSHAETKDAWFCTEESGKRDDNILWACGVGESTFEAQARQSALDHAIEEFETICAISSDCRSKRVSIEPKRMTCTEKKGIVKCYRLIEVRLDGKAFKPLLQAEDQSD